MRTLFYIFLTIFIFQACNTPEKKSEETQQKEVKEQVAANLKSIEVSIEGMTCEIGCARMIESKLSKFKGVTYAKVSFEDKKGVFTFDSNTLSEKDIAQKIATVGGGDLYSVTETHNLSEIIK